MATPCTASEHAPSRRPYRLLVAAAVAWACFAGEAAARWGGGFGYNRGGYASTAAQGAAYGISEVLRARGTENLLNSEAAKNWEDAKTLDIQNKMRWTETYFEMRKVNSESRAAEAGPPVTQEQAIRLAKMRAPSRLGSTQLDPVTGQINYPLILRAEDYAKYRDPLDRMFADRASSGGSISYEQYEKIQGTVSEFKDALRQNVQKYKGGDYGIARTFLDSLAQEARMPAG
jgi:hypothetical protein